ncbi:hypothetical protein COX08_02690 [Candidatus Beckwithbacteria bacterium CG23_combo_of_CG06-09_8_20_14_all_34_8]|uniref:Nudix hydrolase domain-containing protein n=1 Tax=Candidatus Beckwithbacteria bacterium CG23_combo_of_CG06-09_8_20_14_all_34_8 TaxID=1974497 RepID=A0A2H0B641_9BACT|nr:MAG: hypothetical protein COX08_02690 [Candidatus Beckwithbacteria bacterium CG23_combo_of_CG06-09_8_20_14_all_34_8]
MDTKQEFSAGGVVFKKPQSKDNKITTVFLLGKHSGYHKWVLPKGLIEAGEIQEQTAIRETEEEMGVVAKIVKSEPIYVEKYTYTADYKKASDISLETPQSTRRIKQYQEAGGKSVLVKKTVTFYLMEWVSGDPVNDHGWEMSEAGWFDFDKCMEMMGFEGEKEALKKVIKSF